MKQLRNILLLLLIGTSFQSMAQFETTLPNMRGLYQSSYINPAFKPEYKLSVGLPVINNLGLQFNLSGLDLHTIGRSIVTYYPGTDTVQNVFDFNKLNDKMDGPLGFNIPVQFDLLYFRFPIKGYYIGINNSMKLDQTFNITKEFLGFLSAGNLPAVGQQQNFEMMRLNINYYNETGISISKEFKRFSFGIRAKYLKGLANIQTEDVKFVVNTQSAVPYAIEVNMNGNVHVAGLPILTSDSVDGKLGGENDTSDMTKTMIRNAQAFNNNSGFGFDIGIGYQFSTRLSGFASVVDLGSKINWNANTYNYKIDESKIAFNGLSYSQAVNGTGALFDSLTEKLGKSYVTSEKYSTTIPTKYYAGLDYDLTLRDRITFLFQGISYLGDFNQAYTISYNHRFFRNLQITGNYSLKNMERHDLGFGMTTKFGPLQFYLMADNLYGLIEPERARTLYFRLGFNLVFGRNVKVKKMFL